MKLTKLAALLLLIPILFAACGSDSQKNELITVAAPSDPMQERLVKRCGEVASFYDDICENTGEVPQGSNVGMGTLSQSSIDSLEERLRNAGYGVMDTSDEYPSYFLVPNDFYRFWNAVTRQEAAEQEVITILESGKISYVLFTYDETGSCFYAMMYDPGNAEPFSFEKHEILDWELTEKGNFYYRIYPENNKHYADYTLIRLTKPDPVLYDLTARYILPVNYLSVNLFLTDWTEADFGKLSFNDLFEPLCQMHSGEAFCPENYVYNTDLHSYEIPAAEFEETVMPYFHIDMETFRELAGYRADGGYYPYRDLETNDFVHLWYYTTVPEVTACTINGDDTITLTVEVLSTDLKMDCLFAHEVTIRPLDDGKFQYVGNKMIFQTEYGLPNNIPRLEWRG